MKNALLVALLLAVGATSSYAQAVKSKVISVTGEATATLPSGKTIAVEQGQLLSSGTVITTGEGSDVIISPFPGSSYDVKPNSTISVNKVIYKTSGTTLVKRHADLRLSKGAVFFHVDPGHEEATDFRVHAGSSVAAARGCDDLVSLYGGTLTVSAATGTLTFSGPGGTTTLTGGQVSTMSPTGVPSPATAITPAQAAQIQASVNAMVNAGAISPAAAAALVNVLTSNGLTISPALQNVANQNPANSTPPTKTVLQESNEPSSGNSSGGSQSSSPPR